MIERVNDFPLGAARVAVALPACTGALLGPGWSSELISIDNNNAFEHLTKLHFQIFTTRDLHFQNRIVVAHEKDEVNEGLGEERHRHGEIGVFAVRREFTCPLCPSTF